MFEFTELRYSYSNFLEFISEGFKPEHINIYLGFLLILAISFYIFRAKENIHLKFITLYFSLSFFTNFAYQMYRARFFDYVGIAITLIVILILLKDKLKILFFEKVLYVLATILFLHLLILLATGYFDKYGAAERIFFQRMVMVLRLFVLFFVVLYFTNFVKTEKHIDFIVSTFKYAGMVALSVMVIQEILFFGFGFKTTGLYFAIGYIPIPRFGSVSIEGGHFGRLLPTFLVYFLVAKKGGLKITCSFVALLILALTNLSGSLYGYIFFIVVSLFIVNIFIFKIRGIKFLGVMICLAALIISYGFPQYWLLFSEKVFGLLLNVDNRYSGYSIRSIDFLFRSLSEFPLGIGFGGSNRFLPDGSLTDSGIYAIISQLSLLSVVFIFIFSYYWVFLLRNFVKYKETLIKKRYAAHSLIMMLACPLIFFFDIVWLYPGYILPFLILMVYIKKEKLEELQKLREPCPA